MAVRRKRIEELLDAAAARGAAVVGEQLRGEIRAVGEGLETLREQMARGFAETNRRFEQVDRRFDVVERDIAQVKNDVAQLKDDVAVLRDDVGLLKHDVAVLKDDVSDVKYELSQVKDAVTVHQRQLRDANGQLGELRVAVDRKVDRDEVEGIVERAVARAVGQ